MEKQLGGDSAGAIYEEMARATGPSQSYSWCDKLKQKTPAEKICTGFFWKAEYTPALGCRNCRHWKPL